MKRLYARVLLGSLRRGGDSLPGATVSAEVAVDRSRLAAYARVCGFRLRDELPATYPHVLAFPLSLRLLADPGFRLGALGLVHVANRIEVLRPVRADERLGFRCRFGALSRAERGWEFELLTELEVGGETVWTERSTYLRVSGGGSAGRSAVAPPQPSAIWTVPASVGRRYARVSGDWNPIHVSRAGARLLGQRSPIAHGMWTLARACAALEPVLPGAVVIDARFRRPVRLPSRVAFSWAGSLGGSGRSRSGAFAVHDVRSGAPCLTGNAHLRGDS